MCLHQVICIEYESAPDNAKVRPPDVVTQFSTSKACHIYAVRTYFYCSTVVTASIFIAFSRLVNIALCTYSINNTRDAGRMKGRGGQLFNKGHVLNKYIFTIRTHSSEYIYTHAEQL